MLRGDLWFFALGQALLSERSYVYRLEVRSLPEVLTDPLLGRIQQATLLDLFTDHDTEVNTRPFSIRLLGALSRIKSRDHPKVLDNFLSLLTMTGRLHSNAIGSHDLLPRISPI